MKIAVMAAAVAIGVAGEQQFAKCKMRAQADVAVWRGIVFGTNWFDIEDMRLVRDEYNPWPYAGLRAGVRTSEPGLFGGVPVESIMYSIHGAAVIGVRVVFDMRYYPAMLAKCRAFLGPTGARDNMICWQGTNLTVVLCKYHTETCGMLDVASAKAICKIEKHAEVEGMREFQ